VRRLLAEHLRIEATLLDARAEVAAADLPDRVPAVLEVVLRQAALAGVVGEPTEPRTAVEREDRVRRQRTEAHRRHVQQRRRIANVIRKAHAPRGLRDP